MFSVMMVIALGILLTVLRTRNCSPGKKAVPAIVLIIVPIWIVSMTVGTYTCQLSDFTLVKEIKMQINLDSERRDKLIGVLKVELSKYPEIEKGIINGIKPDMMLLSQFPTLKSNETITNMVKGIVELENSVYRRRSGLISLQRRIYYREISPWVIYSVTSYAKFFKEKNPFAD